MADHEQLQEQLGYRFRDPELLALALTHPSIGYERSSSVETNQRLEFLGDAVLQLILTEELYARYRLSGEGPLTKARARLVNCRSLADQARQLELGRHLAMSRGEEMHGGRDRPSALADVFESVLGAMFLDGGFEAAKKFVLRRFESAFSEMTELPTIDNPKGELQELLQSVSPEPPRYRVVSTSGPDQDRQFECTVHHCGAELASGTGKSKKSAESHAARIALEKLRAQRAADSPAGENAPA